MKFMVMIKADKDSESGIMPSQEVFAEMGRYNEELVNAGVMLAGEGLLPSSKGARVRFGGGKVDVIDGPFAESKELLAGYWIWQCDSLADAIAWVKRGPFPADGPQFEIEVRQIGEMDDMGENFTPELREQEARIRAKSEELANR